MADFTLIIKAVDQATAVLKNIDKSMQDLQKRAGDMDKAVNGSLSKIMDVAGRGATAFAALTVSAATYAKSISDASDVTGVSVQTILALGQGMGVAGGEARKAGDAVDKFGENLGNAKQGSFDTQYAFGKLGVTMKDLNTLSNEDIFKKSIQGLGNIADKAQQAALKQQFFGKTLDGVNVSAFSNKLDEMTAAQVKNADAVKNAAQTIDVLKSAYNKLEMATLNALKPLTDAIGQLDSDKFDKLATAIVNIGLAVTGLIALNATINILAKAWAILTGAITAYTAAATGVAARILAIGAAATGVAEIVAVLIGVFMVVSGVLKYAFDYDIVKEFVDWVGRAYTATKEFLGLKGPTFLSQDEVDRESALLKKRQDALNNATGGGSSGGAKNAAVENLKKNFAQLIDTYGGLGGKMNLVDRNLSFEAMKFNELSSAAERLGVVLQKPTDLITRDFSVAIQKNAEQLRQHSIEMQDAGLMSQKFANDLRASQLQLNEQQLKLNDAGVMEEQFKQEVIKSSQALLENALKLRDNYYQQAIFEDSVIKVRQELDGQVITLTKLDEAYANGTISLREYGDALGKVDQRLLDSSQIAAQVISQGTDEANSYQTRKAALDAVTQAYNDGKISIEAYTSAFEKLNLTYSATPLSIVLDKSKKLATQYDQNEVNARALRDEVAKGNVTWKEYEAAVQAIGQEHFPEYSRQLRELTPMSVEFTRVVQDSATKMSDSFTDSFYQILKEGKFTFSAFKDMVTGILDDIAKLVIRKAFADPIASGIAGIITGMQQGGASSGGGFGGIFSSIGGAMGKWFGGGGGAATNTGLEGMSAETLALAGLASGGVVTKPTLAMIGEGGGPEAVIPLSQTNNGTYDLGMGNRDSAPVVNFTLNAVDTQTGVEFLLKNKPAIIKVVQDAYDTRGRRGPVNS